MEFTQVLQDMISDLTGAPQPIQIKLFSPDGNLLNQWAPRVADAIGKVQVRGKKPVVDILNGVDDATSGPALVFQVNPQTAARAGFTTEEVELDASAIMEGEPATTPVVRQRPGADAAGALSAGQPGFSRCDEQHAAGQLHRADRHARLTGAP